MIKKVIKKINWKFIKNKIKDKWFKWLLVILCSGVCFFALKNKLSFLMPKNNIDNFITTLLATLIGGIISICTTVIVTNKLNKQKAIIDRKESVYVPLYNELKRVKWNIDNSNFDYNFDTEVVESILKGYKKSTISKRVKKLLIDFAMKRNDYKKINHSSIVINIIIENFILGFKDLYGSEIEGERKVRDYEGNAELIEEEYEDVKNIRHLSQKDITKILNLLDGKYSFELNYALVNLYDSYINDERETIIELPEPEWASYGQEVSKGQYIVENYSFLEKFLNNSDVMEKSKIRNDLTKIVEECILEIEYILIDIYTKYEKDIY